jgi:hypothetical protein
MGSKRIRLHITGTSRRRVATGRSVQTRQSRQKSTSKNTKTDKHYQSIFIKNESIKSMSSHKTPLVMSEHRDDPFGVWGEIFDDFIDAVIGAAPISLNDITQRCFS